MESPDHENHVGDSRCHLPPRQGEGCRTETPLRQFVSEAVVEKLGARSPAGQKARMKLAGSLRHLRKERARINTLIEQEFEKIEPEEWLDLRHRTQESVMPAVCYR
jgi:hypothetical protein